MAKGKDAFFHALSILDFHSINFQNLSTKNHWYDKIPGLISKETNKNIENPAQRVVLEFSSDFQKLNKEGPLIILCDSSKNINQDAKIVFEASSGEDCARLLFVSHIVCQRFAKPVVLVISMECLENDLKFKPEHIPFPPKFVIRDKTWKPDIVKSNHPALNFKRISFEDGKGPRDKSNLLIISHGKNSIEVNKLIENSNSKNIRHLELQTLRPISLEIIESSMRLVEKIITTVETYKWISEFMDIRAFELDDIESQLK